MAINFSSAEERVRIGKDEMDLSDAGQSRLEMDFSDEDGQSNRLEMDFFEVDSQLQHRHSTNRGDWTLISPMHVTGQQVKCDSISSTRTVDNQPAEQRWIFQAKRIFHQVNVTLLLLLWHKGLLNR